LHPKVQRTSPETPARHPSRVRDRQRLTAEWRLAGEPKSCRSEPLIKRHAASHLGKARWPPHLQPAVKDHHGLTGPWTRVDAAVRSRRSPGRKHQWSASPLRRAGRPALDRRTALAAERNVGAAALVRPVRPDQPDARLSIGDATAPLPARKTAGVAAAGKPSASLPSPPRSRMRGRRERGASSGRRREAQQGHTKEGPGPRLPPSARRPVQSGSDGNRW